MQAAQDLRRRSPTQRILLVLAVIVGALLVLALFRLGVAGAGPAFHGTTYEPPEPAADFTLTDHHGQPQSLTEFRGAPLFLFFGYTHCPDVCPLTLRALDRALAAAGPAAEDASVLLITVDPERDTPEVLASYVAGFGANVVGLTGEEAAIREILASYGAYSEPGHEHPQLLSHTSLIFGVDSEGLIRVLLRPDAPADEFQQDVEALLRL